MGLGGECHAKPNYLLSISRFPERVWAIQTGGVTIEYSVSGGYHLPGVSATGLHDFRFRSDLTLKSRYVKPNWLFIVMPKVPARILLSLTYSPKPSPKIKSASSASVLVLISNLLGWRPQWLKRKLNST